MDATRDAALPPLTVELRLEPAVSPGGSVHVEGSVTADGAPPRPFSGWMALLEVLEALVGDPH